MSSNENDQKLMAKARARVRHKTALIIHIVFWILISVIIIVTVDLKTGLMLFAFFGITVVGNAIAYFLTSRKITKGYTNAVQREYEKMKSDE